MMPAVLKHPKGHQDHLNRPTILTFGTNTDFYIKNGRHLEKWAPFICLF